MPWVLFSPVLTGGAPLAGCNAACPANGLMLADSSRSQGTGLTNMRERLAVIGGSLAIDSRPGNGMRVSGRIPVRRAG